MNQSCKFLLTSNSYHISYLACWSIFAEGQDGMCLRVEILLFCTLEMPADQASCAWQYGWNPCCKGRAKGFELLGISWQWKTFREVTSRQCSQKLWSSKCILVTFFFLRKSSDLKGSPYFRLTVGGMQEAAPTGWESCPDTSLLRSEFGDSIQRTRDRWWQEHLHQRN